MSAPNHNRKEQGSAYLIALLGLMVLTIVGITLASVTTTEMEIGLNERQATRAFYSAEAGIGVAIARSLVQGGQLASQQFTLSQDRQITGVTSSVNRSYVVDVSPFFPVQVENCNWCPDGGRFSGEASYSRVNFAVSATSQERTWQGTEETPPADANVRSQKTIATMFEATPIVPLWESLPTDADQLAKVKF